MKIKDMEISLDGIHMNNIRIVANNRHSFIIFAIDFERSGDKRYYGGDVYRPCKG